MSVAYAVGGQQFGADVQVSRRQRVVFYQDLLEGSAGRTPVRSSATEALRHSAGDPCAQRPAVA